MEFKLQDSLGFLLNSTNTKLKNELFKRFKKFDITPEQWSVLNCLWIREGTTPKEISDMIYKDKANTNHILEKLVKKNLILKMQHETDRRAYQIYLTKQGKELEDKLVPIVELLCEEATRDIAPEKVYEMKTFLRAMFHNLENNYSEP